jgi:hypothetical protein
MRRDVWIFLSMVLLAAGAGPARGGDELLGLLTRVDGEVVLETASADGVEAGPTVVARSLQVIHPGVRVRLGDGARVAVVCSSNHAVRLAGPMTWTLNAGACEARGQSLPAGSFRSLRPVEASLQRFDGAFVKQLPTRGDEGAIPVTVLLPRGRYAGGTPEKIVWLDRQGFDQFEIRFEGPDPKTWQVSAADARCAPAAMEWPGEAPRLCETAHPNPDLAPGGTGRVRIYGRLPDKRFFETEYGEARAERLEAALDAKVVAWRQSLQPANLDRQSLRWLEAAHSRRRQLGGDATQALRELWRDTPDPRVALVLGDLYLAGELPELGSAFYRVAMESGDEGLSTGVRERLAALETRQAVGGAP